VQVYSSKRGAAGAREAGGLLLGFSFTERQSGEQEDPRRKKRVRAARTRTRVEALWRGALRGARADFAAKGGKGARVRCRLCQRYA